jgi:hypothetical protein
MRAARFEEKLRGSKPKSGSVAYDVRGAQALGALRALELDGFALIQRSVPRILNRGKVHENVFAARPLDKPVSLSSV